MTRLDEPPADDDDIVLRGGVPTAENLRRNAEFTLELNGFLGVSVFVAVGGRDWRELLLHQVALPNNTVSLTKVAIVSRHFELRKTGTRPYHYDIVLPDLSDDTVETLRDLFDVQRPNPAPRRGP